MESLVHHYAATAESPAGPAMEGLSFQPIFSADGLVLEYAVASPRHAWRRHIPGRPARLAREAFAFFRSFHEHIPFTLDCGGDLSSISWSAAELCASSGLALDGTELLANPNPAQEERFGANAAYPARLVTFHAPLVSHLHARSHLFSCYAEFNIGLRIRLTPTMARGGPSAHGALQVTGLHVKAPPDFSEFSSLRSRFIELVQRAEVAKLPLLVSNVNHAHDLHWMRLFPDLRILGSVLSPPMGSSSLKALLTLGGDNWRTFRVGARYP
ncbi:hypothetical protein [Achromobacter sp. RTa]|uniref:hypothetical protein n=1 Tax=Achromobacter sp. RTa TaxID=1532557 RepID=UPI0012E01131|nr:hypothetical protein [Achromobacter sp. RTa]